MYYYPNCILHTVYIVVKMANYKHAYKGDGARFQHWETNWKHPDFPNLMVAVEYDTTDADEQKLTSAQVHLNSSSAFSNATGFPDKNIREHATSKIHHRSNCSQTYVKNVNISIDIDDEDTGILFMNNEMEPLIEHCQVGSYNTNILEKISQAKVNYDKFR